MNGLFYLETMSQCESTMSLCVKKKPRLIIEAFNILVVRITSGRSSAAADYPISNFVTSYLLLLKPIRQPGMRLNPTSLSIS